MKYTLMTLMSIIALSVTGCGDDTEDTAVVDTAATNDQDGGSEDE